MEVTAEVMVGWVVVGRHVRQSRSCSRVRRIMVAPSALLGRHLAEKEHDFTSSSRSRSVTATTKYLRLRELCHAVKPAARER